MTLTIDLPDSFLQQLKEKQISEEELKTVAVTVLKEWLAQRNSNSEPFGESPAAFARRLIEKNRQLFESLARR